MLSAKDFRTLAERGDVYTIIMNGKGESALSGPIHKMASVGDKLRAQWTFEDIPESDYPYKYALITDGNRNYVVFQLQGFEGRDFSGSTLEVAFE